VTNGTEKKGLSPLAWIGIGCGALVVLGGIALAALVGFGVFKAKEFAAELEKNPAKVAAETAVRFNPELELLESDDEAGTITFRNKKTGEVATLSFEDMAEGKFSLTTEEGTFSLDASAGGEGGGMTISGPEGEARFGAGASLANVPDWVPIYPGAAETQGSYHAETPEGVSGIVACKSADAADKVVDYYREELEAAGFEITAQSTNTTPQGSFSSLTAELAEEGRTLAVGVVGQEGETQITINYNRQAQ